MSIGTAVAVLLKIAHVNLHILTSLSGESLKKKCKLSETLFEAKEYSYTESISR
jgi:hypothetical protein